MFVNASLCAFLNVAAPFVYCIFWPFESIIFNSLSRLIYINFSLNDKHSCQRFNTTLTKIDEIPILLVNLSIIFLLFRPFQWRYLQVLGDAFIMKLYGREYLHVAATHLTFPKLLMKWSKCTHVLTFDVDFSIYFHMSPFKIFSSLQCFCKESIL